MRNEWRKPTHSKIHGNTSGENGLEGILPQGLGRLGKLVIDQRDTKTGLENGMASWRLEQRMICPGQKPCATHALPSSGGRVLRSLLLRVEPSLWSE